MAFARNRDSRAGRIGSGRARIRRHASLAFLVGSFAVVSACGNDDEEPTPGGTAGSGGTAGKAGTSGNAGNAGRAGGSAAGRGGAGTGGEAGADTGGSGDTGGEPGHAGEAGAGAGGEAGTGATGGEGAGATGGGGTGGMGGEGAGATGGGGTDGGPTLTPEEADPADYRGTLYYSTITQNFEFYGLGSDATLDQRQGEWDFYVGWMLRPDGVDLGDCIRRPRAAPGPDVQYVDVGNSVEITDGTTPLLSLSRLPSSAGPIYLSPAFSGTPPEGPLDAFIPGTSAFPTANLLDVIVPLPTPIVAPITPDLGSDDLVFDVTPVPGYTHAVVRVYANDSSADEEVVCFVSPSASQVVVGHEILAELMANEGGGVSGIAQPVYGRLLFARLEQGSAEGCVTSTQAHTTAQNFTIEP